MRDIDYNKLQRGLYVFDKHKDLDGNIVATTFEIRMKIPNREAALDSACVHTITHIAISFLQNNPIWQKRLIHFGPMGSRCGFYLILAGDVELKIAAMMVSNMFSYIVEFLGDIPWASKDECGNFLDHNLSIAKLEANRYLERDLSSLDDNNTVYPYCEDDND